MCRDLAYLIGITDVNVFYSATYVSVTFFFQYPVVLLAGEAAHERYFSTTHGAYESGQAQARVILDYLNGQRSSSIKRQSN
jgi:hypothetical protein